MKSPMKITKYIKFDVKNVYHMLGKGKEICKKFIIN